MISAKPSLARALVVALVAASTMVLTAGASSSTPLPATAGWRADVHRVFTVRREPYANVTGYLDARVARGGAHLGLVLDIDNTSIASHYDWPHAVLETLSTADRYSHRGVAALFVTGRPQSQVPMITGVLRRAGYHPVLVCGRAPGYTVEAGKQNCRQRLVARGYTLIANIGNLPTDFTGGYYEHFVVDLPDYYGALG